ASPAVATLNHLCPAASDVEATPRGEPFAFRSRWRAAEFRPATIKATPWSSLLARRRLTCGESIDETISGKGGDQEAHNSVSCGQSARYRRGSDHSRGPCDPRGTQE